jgi:hypothetical protein
MTQIELEVLEALERLVKSGEIVKYQNEKGEDVYGPAPKETKLRIVI